MKRPESKGEAQLVDASAFYQGVLGQSIGSTFYTTKAILEEVRHLLKDGLEALLLERNRLEIREPSLEKLREVGEVAEALGEGGALSPADLSLLALGLELKGEGMRVVVLSDDRALQNLASALGLKFRSLGSRSITHLFKWVIYCPGCGFTYRGAMEECPRCGTRLKRKVRKRRPIESSTKILREV